MTKRARCIRCRYPIKTCVCAHANALDCNIQISIMQDPSEAKHAKNTARLIPLLLPQTDIFVGEQATDFHVLKKKIQQHPNTLLIYPCEHALKIGDNSKVVKPNVDHLILIDGTWRKAKKLYLCNPWLHDLDAGVLSLSEPSHYRIRQGPFAYSYSTIEALGHTLNALRTTPVTAFIKLLDALQQHWPTQK